MKTIYDKQTQEELIERINLLDENSQRQWGKMTVRQMLKHCLAWDEMSLGKMSLTQVFIGKLFGKVALKNFLKDDKPVKRNMGTLPELKITEDIKEDLNTLKEQWTISTKKYTDLKDNHEYIHSFFGKLNKEQIGILAYKHADHHLRQFAV
ncbi:MAG TPA: DUF1569 domain-containing protein [Puia sp.]|nr:DUF1569 domain-containing protein [Puia sp.]